MKLFIRSLTREALIDTQAKTCKNGIVRMVVPEFIERFRFNNEVILDWFHLMKMENKSIESFKEYAIRWRADAVKVQPPMVESEMTSLFVQSQKDATYYDKLISVVAQKFSEVVRIAEFVEEGIKMGRITNLVALQVTSKAMQSNPTRGSE